MADQETSSDDKTEDATPEKKEELRESGQLPLSREFTSVAGLCGSIYYLSQWTPRHAADLAKLFTSTFESIHYIHINQDNILPYATLVWTDFLWTIVPLFLIVSILSISATFIQTRLNWSWSRLKPDFSRLNPSNGLARLFEFQNVLELIKSIAKLTCLATIAFLVLRSEWARLPALMNWPITSVWSYWSQITKDLFWTVAIFLLVLSSGDFFYQFISYERRIKMTKQEVKEEYKRREVDPQVRGRMRRMQRDAVMRNTIAKTKKATALITNPTHFSVAIKYDLNDTAPIVLAKGEDDLALRMRSVARDERIPIIENRPLARALYAQVEEGEVIPTKFYAAVAEVIKYVFKLKGRRLPIKQRTLSTPKEPDSNTQSS